MAASAAAEVELSLPQVFGRYVLLKRLSRGGMGEIFLGRVGEIQGFEKPVIIKKVLPNLAADEEFVHRFIDEAQVAIKLSHANIASVFEVGKVDDEYFLALEYIEGRDLRRLLTRCRQNGIRVPVDLALYVARELANGLGYAHRRTDNGKQLALVHCDISPPNVMVSFEGEVKVIDFGIAKSAIRIAGSNPNIGFGKFGYMAPEQLLRGGVVDRRTDIYAAGVVLYELLTGERLFTFPEGADYRAIARIVTRGEFVPASERADGIDPSLDPIVARAVAPKADERYQTCEEFRDALTQKLYQMNPTFSADALAEFMRGLFGSEIDEERDLVKSTREIHVEQFKDELQGSQHHTVSFAFAGPPGQKRPTGQNGVIAGPSDVLPPLASGRMPALVGAGVLAAMLGGGALVYFVARQKAPPPVETTPAMVVAPAPVAADPPQLPVPIVTSTPIPQHRVDRERDVEPVHHKATKVAAHVEPRGDEAPPAARPTVDGPAVSAKFKTVRKEYDAFKGEYGPRLEGQWTAIVNEITFGKADKFQRVDGMLDNLRRDMAKVRSGG